VRDEAKIVAVEQEAKKKTEQAEKARLAAAFSGASASARATDTAAADAGSRGIDGVAFANPLLPQGGGATSAGDDTAAAPDDQAAAEAVPSMPGAMEATEGIAPEIATHSEETIAGGEELSPEEKAIQGPGGDQLLVPDGDGDRKDFADEDTDTAALAEGRAEPPTGTRDEP
jgi:hypothetical protein